MKDQFLALLEKSKAYTLGVVNAMPENSFDFKPVESVWTFNELSQHIAYGIHWWGDNYVKGGKTEWNPPAIKGGKKEAVALLEKAYDSLKKTIESEKMTNGAAEGVHATLDHITHHRAQAIIYLRSQGIAPPEYTY